MYGKIQIIGYNKANTLAAFNIIAYSGKKYYLGSGTYNFISGITRIKINKTIPNIKEEVLKALSTNDWDEKVEFNSTLDPRFKYCKF